VQKYDQNTAQHMHDILNLGLLDLGRSQSQKTFSLLNGQRIYVGSNRDDPMSL
jgi:hypothetical protein